MRVVKLKCMLGIADNTIKASVVYERSKIAIKELA